MSEPIGPMPTPPDEAPIRGQEKQVFDSNVELWGAWEQEKAEYWNGGAYQAINAAIDAAAGALAASSFQGNWSDQSGAAAVPYSVVHNSKFYMLKTALADVTTVEPGVTGGWASYWEELLVTNVTAPSEKAFTFTGSASAGDPVVMNSDGTVSAVTETADGTWGDETAGFTMVGYNNVGFNRTVAHDKDSGWFLATVNYMGQNQTNWDAPSHAKMIVSFRLDSNGKVRFGGQAMMPAPFYQAMGLCAFPESGGFLVMAIAGSTAYDGAHLFHVRLDPLTGGIGFGGSLMFARATGQKPVSNFFHGASSGDGQCLITYRAETTDDLYCALVGLNSDNDIELLEEDYMLAAHVGSYGGGICHDPINDCWNVTHVTSNSSGKHHCRKITTDATSITGNSTVQLDTDSVGANNLSMIEFDVDVGKPIALCRMASNDIEYFVVDNSAGTPTATAGASAGFSEGTSGSYGASFSVPKAGSSLVGVIAGLTSSHPWVTLGEQLSGDTMTWSETELSAVTGYGYLGIGTDMGALLLGHTPNLADNDSGSIMRAYFTHTTNLTEENFIGFAQEAATDGQTKKVVIEGGIITGLSGLTPGKDIFVRPDASIGHTRKDRGVRVGTALTATTAIVRRGNSL